MTLDVRRAQLGMSGRFGWPVPASGPVGTHPVSPIFTVELDRLVARRRRDLLSTETTCYELVNHRDWPLQSLGICTWELLTRHPQGHRDAAETVFRREAVQLLVGALHVTETGPWLMVESSNRPAEDLTPLVDMISNHVVGPGAPADDVRARTINGTTFTGRSNRQSTAVRGVLGDGNTVTLFAHRMPLPDYVTLQSVESFEPYLTGWQHHMTQLQAGR